MDANNWTAIDQYVGGLFAPHDGVLDEVLAASAAAGLPDIQVTPSQGKFLHLLAKICGARRILEVGTLGGYSTIWMARALPAGGRVVTLEVNPRHADVARTCFERAGLANVIELRVGPALETLERLSADGVGVFDLFFIDADKRNNVAYVEWATKLARPGSVIVVDNVIRHGRVVDADSADPDIQATRQMNALIAADPRLSAVTIQTVGAKGHDGFLLATVAGG